MYCSISLVCLLCTDRELCTSALRAVSAWSWTRMCTFSLATLSILHANYFVGYVRDCCVPPLLGRRAALLVSCLSWGTASCGGCARLRRDVGMKSARVVHGRLGLWRSWGEGRASEARGCPCALCFRRFSHVCLVGGQKQQQTKTNRLLLWHLTCTHLHTLTLKGGYVYVFPYYSQCG